MKDASQFVNGVYWLVGVDDTKKPSICELLIADATRHSMVLTLFGDAAMQDVSSMINKPVMVLGMWIKSWTAHSPSERSGSLHGRLVFDIAEATGFLLAPRK